MRNVLNRKKIKFFQFLFFELWSFLYPNFRWIFHDKSKNKNQKIDFSFDSAHCASFIKNGAKLRGGGGVCISLVGKYPIIWHTLSHCVMTRIGPGRHTIDKGLYYHMPLRGNYPLWNNTIIGTIAFNAIHAYIYIYRHIYIIYIYTEGSSVPKVTRWNLVIVISVNWYNYKRYFEN